MRPRRLVVQGLRSFRSRIEINFGDRYLVAIVGDTGAGKSSILEAITYALYGGASWTDRAGDLISDTADHMLVELAFDVDGDSYRVRRTASRTSRASTAQLQGPDGAVIDDVRPVNAAVVKLIGLDREAFLKTVILPQGKFAELLHATPSERNEVLKGIFRVDVLEGVNEQAKKVRDRLWPQVEGLKQRRAAFPANPAAAVEAAVRAQEESAAAAEYLAQLQGIAEGHEEARAEAEKAAEAARQAVVRLGPDTAPKLSRRIEELLARANEFEAERQTVEAEMALVRGQLSELHRQREKAIADGQDIAQLASTYSTLARIVEELPAISDTVDRLREYELHIAELADQLSPLCEQAELARREAETTADAAEGARTARRSADEAMQRADVLLGSVRMVAVLAHEADDAVAAARTKDDTARKQFEDAERRREDALPRHRAAQSVLEHLRRQHAAAHAAQGVGPGEPCPVCTRELPYDFSPPAEPAMEAAVAEAGRKQQQLNKAHGDVSRAKQAVEEADERLTDAIAEQARRQAEVAQAVDELARHLQVSMEQLELDADNEAVLAKVREAARQAEQAELTTAEASRAAEKIARESEEAERQLTQRLENERRRLAEAYGGAKDRLHRLDVVTAGLPGPWRPQLPDPHELGTVELSTLDSQPVEVLAEAVRDRLSQLKELDRHLNEARSSEERFRRALADLDESYANEVVLPAGTVRSEIVLLDERLAQAACTLQAVFEPIDVPADIDLARLRDVATHLGRRQDDLGGLSHQIVERHDREVCDATSMLFSVLAEAQADDLEALRARAIDAQVAAGTADERLLEAKKAAEQAELLDRQLGRVEQVVDDLERLREHLGRGQKGFIGHLITRRAHVLLGVAGQHLDAMSGGRYAFTGEFEILDQLTGLPRNAKTLSGGESFLASLALALGMVDLAARAGGRLDALFLDEGFGALDTTNLNAAIDALEATAQTGRMVGIISHVRAVAERIADVMIVITTPEGSCAFWLDEPQRAGLTQEDAAAALAGLLD